MDSNAMLLAIQTNPVSSTRRVSGELGFSQSNVIVTFMASANTSGAVEDFKTFDLPLANTVH